MLSQLAQAHDPSNKGEVAKGNLADESRGIHSLLPRTQVIRRQSISHRPADTLHSLVNRDEPRRLLRGIAERAEEPVGETLPEGIVHPVEDVEEAWADVEFGVGEVLAASVSEPRGREGGEERRRGSGGGKWWGAAGGGGGRLKAGKAPGRDRGRNQGAAE